MKLRAPLLLLVLAALAAPTPAAAADPAARPSGRRPFGPSEAPPSSTINIDELPLESLRGLKPAPRPATNKAPTTTTGTDRFESLSLRPRPKAPASTTPTPGYLDAWSAAHDGAEPTEDARAIDAFLHSVPDPRALRVHVQSFIKRRPAAWLAAPFPHYPSPTGDRAGAWRKIFPDLVHEDHDLLQRQRAFDALLLLLSGTPDEPAFLKALSRNARPYHLLRSCTAESVPASTRAALTPLVAQRLLDVSTDAAKRDLTATAAALALHAHLLQGKGLPDPVPLPNALKAPGPDAPPSVRAQHHAARLLAQVWPPLSPSGAESERLHEILARSRPFSEIRLARTFGLTAAPLVPQNEAVRTLLPSGAPDLALAGEPPRLQYAGLGDTATWAESSGAEIREQLERVRQARLAEQEGIKSAGWARRFHNPEYYQRELAAARGESLPLIQSTTVAEAQQGLANAQARQGELLRDGVYVGRDLNRSDTIFTRPLDSFERRNLDFQIDVERRRLEDARRNDEHNQGIISEHRAHIRSLEQKLNEALRAIRDFEEGWAPRLRALRQTVEAEEARLRKLRGVGVPPAEIEARHEAVRAAELRKHRDERIRLLRAWTTTRDDVSRPETTAEVQWRVWFTGGERDEPIPPSIGGFPLP